MVTLDEQSRRFFVEDPETEETFPVKFRTRSVTIETRWGDAVTFTANSRSTEYADSRFPHVRMTASQVVDEIIRLCEPDAAIDAVAHLIG